MKKLIISLVLCLITLTSMGQVEHMKFMGIPIDGKISAFQKELKKKGFTRNELLDIIPKNTFPDARFYKGLFAEEYVDLVVYFDKKSKIVSHVRVYKKYNSESQVNNKYDSICEKLKQKYDSALIDHNLEEIPNKFGLAIIKSDKTGLLGYIYLERVVDLFAGNFSVAIEYYDYANKGDSKDKEMEDL